jgi:hypothetical protein
VIVIGAHRSGTSALSQVLAALGVFVGARLDPNQEPWFFLRLNDWLLAQCGGRWDHPDVVDDLLADPELRALAGEHLAFSMRTPRAAGYLGVGGYLRTRRIDRLDRPWGFKDPRNTFTLPLWLDLFPDARILHIHRHGVDVAQSLVRRHRAHLGRSRVQFARNRPLLAFLPKRAGFGESPRCATLEGAFGLWEDYVGRARRQVAELGEQALEFRFEDLALDPREVVTRIAAFCGLRPDRAAIERASGLMSAERATAHSRDPELEAFARTMADRVTAVREGRPIPTQPSGRRPNQTSTR